MSIIPGGVAAVVMSRADTNALGFAGARSSCETNSARTLALQDVRINFRAKVF
jgi:hypothetical protein